MGKINKAWHEILIMSMTTIFEISKRYVIWWGTFLFPFFQLVADDLKIAVAANFSGTMEVLAPEFEKQYRHKLVPVFGATGKFYLQIKNGAPFTVFLAADAKHPELLEAEGLAVKGTRFKYATGKLVLWSPKENFVDATGKILASSAFKFVAIANPDVAPYGQAAKEYLLSQKLWEKLTERMTIGQDLSQTFHFVNTGNAELGFLALSQIQDRNKKIKGSYYLIPDKFYKSLEQHGILIKETRAGRDFIKFMKSSMVKEIIRASGYKVF